MYRNEIQDDRTWTSGGQNSAHFGFYRSRYQNGADRSVGTAQSEEHDYLASFVSRSHGYFKWSSITNPVLFGYSNFSPLNTSFVWDSNDDLSLIGQLREKVQQTSLNAGNMLGELPQTVNLLGGKLNLLHKALASVAGGGKPPFQRYRKGKRVPSKRKPPVTGDSLIGDSWLEFSFGVKPLISDIYEIAEIASTQNVARRRVSASRKGRPGVFYSPWTYADCIGSQTFSKQIIVKMEQESLPTFWEQFGLADPATIAWELLPWSFVVDWALPIGKFVEAQSFARRMKGTFITTTLTKSQWSMFLTGDAPGYHNEQLLQESGRATDISRSVASSLDVPLPSFKSSLLGGKPLERIANALALLGQVLK